MGNKSSSQTSQSIVNELTTEAVFKSMTTVETKCNNSASINQNMNITCGTSEEVETERMLNIPGYFEYRNEADRIRADSHKACLDALNSGEDYRKVSGKVYDSVESCENLRFGCVVSGISQDTLLSFKASCEVDADMTSDIQNSIKSELDNAASQHQTDDAFGNIMEDVTSALNVGGSSNDKTSMEVVNQVTNKMSQEINTNFIQEMVGSFSVNQNLTLEGNDGSKTSAISQEATMDIISDMVAKNTSVAKVSNEASTAVATTAEQVQETKGVADMFENLTGMIGGMMSGPFIIVVGIVICVLAFMGMGAMGNGNAPGAPGAPGVPGVPGVPGGAIGALGAMGGSKMAMASKFM